MSLCQTQLVLFLFIVDYFQLFFQLLVKFSSTFHLIFSLLPHALEGVHHFYLLLESCHLYFDFNGFFLELSLCQ